MVGFKFTMSTPQEQADKLDALAQATRATDSDLANTMEVMAHNLRVLNQQKAVAKASPAAGGNAGQPSTSLLPRPRGFAIVESVSKPGFLELCWNIVPGAVSYNVIDFTTVTLLGNVPASSQLFTRPFDYRFYTPIPRTTNKYMVVALDSNGTPGYAATEFYTPPNTAVLAVNGYSNLLPPVKRFYPSGSPLPPPKHTLPDIDFKMIPADKCECGAFKASGTGKGQAGHSTWCPWATK